MRQRAIIGALLVVVLGGCDNIFGLDNYDEPNATLSGRVVYNGKPVGVRSNEIELELWQPGFELEQKIQVFVAQDGSYSASLFDGDYEINLLAGNGPWVTNTTRIPVTVRGNTTLDVPVTPYYTIENEQFALVGGGPEGTVQATFNVGSVDTSRELEYVALYVGVTSFVDPTNRVVQVQMPRAQIADLSAPITLAVQLPDDIRVTPSPALRTKVYARVGVKTVGVAELLYTQVQPIDLQ